jgi:lipoate-protein ligase A
MDEELLPRLIRVGRPSIATTGVRSADKPVSPLSWFTSLSCAEVASHLEQYFTRKFHVQQSEVSAAELEAAHRLVATKYSTPAWVNRLP